MTQVVAFHTPTGLYAIASGFVREITPLGPLTRLPGAPDYVRGVLNLRGTLVTVIDMGLRLSGKPSSSAEPSVIVIEADGRLLGLLVDEVHEVLELDSVTPAGSETEVEPGLVAALGHFSDAVVIVVDAQELVRQTLA